LEDFVTEYVLPELSYDYAALEPHISARIMELHHSKHHAAYVAGANNALAQLADAREKGDFANINRLSKDLVPYGWPRQPLGVLEQLVSGRRRQA